MPNNRASRLAFAFAVAALLLIIGRNIYGHHQEQMLMEAVMDGDDAAATALLDRGVSAADSSELSWLLGYAAMENEPNTVRALLRRGANPNGNPNNIMTPLGAAAEHCPGVIGLLLDSGANVNAHESVGANALTIALNHHMDAARLLLDRGADANSGLAEAVSKGSREAVALLLEHGATGDTGTKASALEVAVTSPQSADLVPLLLTAKPSLSARNKALGAAVRTGNTPIMRVLLAAGAHPDAQSPGWLWDVQTARGLSRSGSAGCTEALALLRPLGITATASKAEIEARDVTGQTALLMVLSDGNTQAAQSLLAQRAEVNVADRQGNTPLLAAIAHDSPLISALLDKGADPNSVTRLGATPLTQAVQANNVALVQELLAHGANPNPHTPAQPSPLARAQKHHQADIAALLQRAGAKE